ncbi:phosphatase PAP2 family protein [Microbulbifer echini]|uniref:undecaprenyl-diphosphate phosphatase n=1 Tax=Microbulbifer echini TaxID=1529067 RepID=A0ABV4NQ14_9GAMM
MKSTFKQMGNYLAHLDRSLLKWAHQHDFRNPQLIKLLIRIGDAPFWILSVVFFAAAGELFGNMRLENISILLMFALIVSNIIFNPIKIHFKRLRPYANKDLQKKLGIQITNRDLSTGSKESESFPSGHVLWTSVSVIVICSQLGWVSVLVLGWLIPAILFLRPYLGVHHPSDALAGLLLGIAVSALTIYLSPSLINLLRYVKEHYLLIYVYWLCITVFLFIGFKLWSRRV